MTVGDGHTPKAEVAVEGGRTGTSLLDVGVDGWAGEKAPRAASSGGMEGSQKVPGASSSGGKRPRDEAGDEPAGGKRPRDEAGGEPAGGKRPRDEAGAEPGRKGGPVDQVLAAPAFKDLVRKVRGSRYSLSDEDLSNQLKSLLQVGGGRGGGR